MKKIFITAILIIAGITASKAIEDKPITIDKLPAVAQEFITQHFSGTKVLFAKMDRDMFDTTYEVVFADGSKVEFMRNGQWKEVDCKHTRVPEGVIPNAITKYITTNHSGMYAVEIDRDKHDYEVKINNGIELKFDLNFNLIGYDN